MIAGLAAGLLCGAGIVLLWSRSWPKDHDAAGSPRPRRRTLARIDSALTHVGFVSMRAEHLLMFSSGLAILVWIVTFAMSGVLVPSIAAGVGGAYLPVAAVMGLGRARQTDAREHWPEVIDLVHSAVRAGLSLPEALMQLGERGPEHLQPPFREFTRDYQASGDFSHALDRLKARLDDPVADRIVEALRITRDVGGTDLGTLLRTLSAFLRHEARVRSEIEARQSWTKNGAKLALVAPWIVLGLMIVRPEAAHAYDTPLGALVIATGAIVSILAYRVMLALARLPQDERVLT